MIRIAWMYPDTLYLHGERGTVLALTHFARLAGCGSRVDRIDMGTKDFDPMDYEVIFYGPGEVPSFPDVIEEISGYRDRLDEFVRSGRILIVTGSSVAMFGESVSMIDGSGDAGFKTAIGLGMIPVRSIEREYVFGDDEYVRVVYNGREMEIIGNQIQMTDIEPVLLTGAEKNGECGSFGKVLYGRGNNGRDGNEGILRCNSVFTNMTGPVLATNPWLTGEIISLAAKAGGMEIDTAVFDYEMELKSLELKKKFIADKSDN